MNTFAKALIKLFFNISIIILISLAFWFIVVWAAGFFAVPAELLQIVGFIIFLYAAYRVLMLVVSFLESNPPTV